MSVPSHAGGSVTSRLGARLRDVGLRDEAALLLSCRPGRGGECRRATCAKHNAKKAKRERANLRSHLAALPADRLVYVVARVEGAAVAAVVVSLREAFDRLRETHAWTRAVDGGVAHVHVNPKGAEVRALVALRAGAKLSASDLRAAWRRLTGGRGRVTTCERPDDLDAVSEYATERAYSKLLGAPDEWLAAWARWVPRARLSSRFGAWWGAQGDRTLVAPKSDFGCSQIGLWLPMREEKRGRSESSGGSRPPNPLEANGRPFASLEGSPGEGTPPPPAERPTPNSAGPPPAPSPRLPVKTAVAQLLAAGAPSAPAMLSGLRALAQEGRLDLHEGDNLADRAASAVAALGGPAELYDELAREVGRTRASTTSPPPAREPTDPREVVAKARAAHERAIRAGDVVDIKPTRAARFTKHGAYLPADLQDCEVVSVHGGTDAKIATAKGESLGRVPLAWLQRAA